MYHHQDMYPQGELRLKVPKTLPGIFSTGQMLSTRHFYFLWVMYLFGCTAGLMVIGLAKDIGVSLVQLDVATAANAVVIIAVFNALGRIVWGSLSDKLGRANSLLNNIYTCCCSNVLYELNFHELRYFLTALFTYRLLFRRIPRTIPFCYCRFLWNRKPGNQLWNNLFSLWFSSYCRTQNQNIS